MSIPIIMKVGSAMGPGGLASLQAGVQMIGALGKRVAGTVKELDRFAQVANHLVGPIGEADAATKGLVDTMALMVVRNKFAAAQMNLTAEQYKHVAVLATKVAQTTGQDVTNAFERLSKSIMLGSSRALKEYGIDLEETEDQALAQAEAMEEVTRQARTMTVELETVSEGIYALGNNLETAAGLAWKKYASGAESALFWLNLLNEGLVDFNAVLDHNDTALSANIKQQERWAAGMRGNVADTFFWLVSLLEDDWFFSGAGKWAAGIRAGAYESQRPGGERLVSQDEKDYAQLGGVRRERAPEPKRKKGAGGKGKAAVESLDPFYEAQLDVAEDYYDITGEALPGEPEAPGVGAAVDVRMAEEAALMAEEAHEAQRERFAARQEWAIIEAEAEQARTDQRIADIERLTGSVEDSASRQAIAQRMIAGAANLAGDATTASIQAIIHGSKGFKAALWNMASQQLASIAATEAILGARDTAAAISYLTTPFTAALAPGKFVAAGKHFAVAALAGAGAVGAGLAGKARGGGASRAPSVGSGGMVYGGGPGGGPAQLDRGGGGQVTYNIVLKDGAETMFDVISEEEERRRRAGQSTLGQAA